MLDATTTNGLIARAKRGDNAAKERLLTENANLMKSIVRRYLGKGVEYDDLYQLAGMGLLKAINGFDESFGVRFSTYAVPMIAGEIKRFMRDDGSIKVSRAIKAEARAINKYIEEYSAEHGCQPTVKQIAGHFSMSESQVVFTMGFRAAPRRRRAGRYDRKAAAQSRDRGAGGARQKGHNAALFPRHDPERGRRLPRSFAGAGLADREQDTVLVQKAARKLKRAAAQSGLRRGHSRTVRMAICAMRKFYRAAAARSAFRPCKFLRYVL